MNTYPILITCENAAYQLAYSASIGSASVFKGIGNEDKAAPAVICYAESKEEILTSTYVYAVDLNIIVKERAKTVDSDDIGALAGKVHNVFLSDTTRQALENATPNFAVYDVIEQPSTNTVEDDAFIQPLRLKVICCKK